MKIPFFNIEISWAKNAKEEKGLPIDPEKMKTSKIKVTPARSSEAPTDSDSSWGLLEEDKVLVEPGYQYEVIPLIRKLSINNPDVGQALANYVALANTGIRINFNSSVKPEQVDKMRRHIKKRAKNWHYGTAGLHGIANKMFAQCMIAGAVSTEIIPTMALDGVSKITFPLPESIRFVYNKKTERYEPYQELKNSSTEKKGIIGNNLKKLNINTYKYLSINGDTEIPYGNPPYLPSLPALADQKQMLKNIQFIIRQMGVMGFLELLIDKPDPRDNESDKQYETRLNRFLTEAKSSVAKGMSDGVMVGYQEDHEFKFHSASATAQGVAELFNQNEALVFSGLKQDPSLSGRSTQTGGETNITIVFTKLLSELTNIQLTVAAILEHLIELELRLAGYSFETVEVQFKASTIQDDLKLQQAREIKIRNLRQLRMDGIISQDDYADQLEIEKPYKQEPIVPFAPEKTTGDPTLDAEKKRVREKSKDTSDRRVRDKNKPQGTIKPK